MQVSIESIRYSTLSALKIALVVLLASGAVDAKAQQVGERYDVLAHGAVADSGLLSTAAIQGAIDACFSAGGGVVYFPPGQYKSGTLILKDNVTLYLEQGATLHASRNIDDYRMPLENATRPVFLYANGAQNITLAGGGTIHGGAKRRYEDLRKTDAFIKDITENAREAGVEMKMYYVVKPDVALVIFTDCERVTVQDITLEESSFWTLHIMKSKRVRIHDIKVFSSLEQGVNADGIDINSCSDVEIYDCVISTGDDAIALKTWFDEPCENVSVKRCILTSSSTALKLGTESHGDFRNIRFDSCTILNTNRGLSIVVRDGGSVEDVRFSNITIDCSRRHFNWWGNGDPIWIYLTKKNEHSPVGSIKNVSFLNIQARARGTSSIESTVGDGIEFVVFKNVSLTMLEENYLDKRADHALAIDHVRNLTIQGLTVNWQDEAPEPQWGSALVLSDVEEVQVGNFTGRQGRLHSEDPVISLHNAQSVQLRNCQGEPGAHTLVYVSGARSQSIELNGMNGNKHAKSTLEVDASVIQSETIVLRP